MAQTEHLFWCADDVRLVALKPLGVSYGFSEGADWVVSHFRQTEKGILFNLNEHTDIELSLLGRHNALNGAAVFALSLFLKVPIDAIRRAFQKFSGTARRLEWKGEKRKVVIYDDYGHHPNEISATLKALRDHVRERRLLVVFQPHRYTRVRDLFDQFPSCFGDADEVFMTDIYSAGEAPIEGISSASLYTRLRDKLGSKVHFLPRSHLEEGVAAACKPLDVVLTIGAGDVTKAGEPILDLYAKRAPKLTVGVLFGGASAEHSVSLLSARNVLTGFDPAIYDVKLFGITTEGNWIGGVDALEKLEQKAPGSKFSAAILQELLSCDVCIPILHGPQGEDGMIAGLLETLAIPYAGCDYRSGAICMQKAWTKYVALNHNIPTAPFVETDLRTYRQNPDGFLKKLEERLSYPVFVKPVHLGSSIGVSRAANREEAIRAIELAFHYDDALLVESEIQGRQIEFSVLGNEYVRVALPGEYINHGAFVQYQDKYGATAMEFRVPPHISPVEMALGKELAEKMYRACGCRGLARVDFFLEQNGCYWFNEVNPFPGCTDTSAYPKSWAASGLKMEQIVDELLFLALQRSRKLAEVRGKQ
jgi:UDP-N-acetylmuramate--alanine ligase